jgi:hypothetical protein
VRDDKFLPIFPLETNGSYAGFFEEFVGNTCPTPVAFNVGKSAVKLFEFTVLKALDLPESDGCRKE